ncbi:hypothetical protein [Paraliomyxa miuraensis]|uniref:hypothetical protein n=1 Tax=Paraliomyxa miuraensis TaxID=376150 RepID=UPI00225408B2|nr:hypothetical protein [Paraliomyxa miuraensis]MCX4240493.1 hypothetical protein [Paraliomyxa miuraensis]
MLRRSLRSVSGSSLALLLAVPGCYSGLSASPEADGLSAGEAGDEEGDEEGDEAGEDAGDDAGDDGAGDDDGGEPVAPFQPSDPESYARKVKLLLTGEPVSEVELDAIRTDPESLQDLVRGWTETDAFRVKMLDFFTVTFHQEQITKANIVSQLRGDDATGNFNPRNELYTNLTESFARTAWGIVEQGRPFTEVATTRRWMMTTAMMSFLVAADDDPTKGQQHTFYHNSPPAGMGAGSSVAQQVANRAWYVPSNCVDPSYTSNRRFFVLPALMGRLPAAGCDNFDANAVMNNGDFSDWREVELVTLGPDDDKTPYWDIPALRNAATLGLEIPRTGFFSTPAFLAKWRSNEDNSFRVTTNQALIVALGQSFDDEDGTLPLDESGLSDDHADPTTVCYGCHKNLDPMRDFFLKEFDPDFYSALDEKADVQPSFSFFGEVSEGEDLTDFGQAIAAHPFFAGAWVQKLCFLANSQECNPDDPEFERIREGFIASGYDFRELVIELFSSPLVTGAARTMTHDTNEFLVSINRKAHMCHTLETRLSMTGLCNGNNNVAQAAPEDAWSRGSATPFQPATSSLFYAATMDAFCDRVAKAVVDEADSPLQSTDMEGSLRFLVEVVMDLPPGDSRHYMARTALEDHVEDATLLTQNNRIVLESAFTLACTSPFFTSVGY